VATLDLGGPGAAELPEPKYQRGEMGWSWQGKLTDGQFWHQAPCNVHYANSCVYLVMERRTRFEVQGWYVGVMVTPTRHCNPMGWLETNVVQPGMGWVPWWKIRHYPYAEHIRFMKEQTGMEPLADPFAAYMAAGGDMVEVFARRCRRHGMAPFVSFRLNDWNNRVLNWAIPEVVAHKLAFIEEIIEHLSSKLRVMLIWDRCSGSLQGIGRGQVNPNHLMIDLGGEPVTADGWEDGIAICPDTSGKVSCCSSSVTLIATPLRAGLLPITNRRLMSRECAARYRSARQAWFGLSMMCKPRPPTISRGGCGCVEGCG